MSKSNIGCIQHKVLIIYCPQEFHTENNRQQISRDLWKQISQLGADSEPLCLEGVVPGENQEDER